MTTNPDGSPRGDGTKLARMGLDMTKLLQLDQTAFRAAFARRMSAERLDAAELATLDATIRNNHTTSYVAGWQAGADYLDGIGTRLADLAYEMHLPDEFDYAGRRFEAARADIWPGHGLPPDHWAVRAVEARGLR